eukprot:GHVU01113770.1.p1 GENE.GHVU01113770.1~~GHVU01113770.1.p1  ORF type:complete len:198 (+),score=10.50 GHVU01113770.1:64-657(+)
MSCSCCDCCGLRKKYCCGCSVATGGIITGVLWAVFGFLWITLFQDLSWLWAMTGYNAVLGVMGAIAAGVTCAAWMNCLMWILHILGCVGNIILGIYHLVAQVEETRLRIPYWDMWLSHDDRSREYLKSVSLMALFVLMWMPYTACCAIPIDLHVALWRIRQAGGTGYEYKNCKTIAEERAQKEEPADHEVVEVDKDS